MQVQVFKKEAGKIVPDGMIQAGRSKTPPQKKGPRGPEQRLPFTKPNRGSNGKKYK